MYPFITSVIGWGFTKILISTSELKKSLKKPKG